MTERPAAFRCHGALLYHTSNVTECNGVDTCMAGDILHISSPTTYQVMDPCLLVSTPSVSPALNKNESRLRLRNVRDCGSMRLRP